MHPLPQLTRILAFMGRQYRIIVFACQAVLIPIPTELQGSSIEHDGLDYDQTDSPSTGWENIFRPWPVSERRQQAINTVHHPATVAARTFFVNISSILISSLFFYFIKCSNLNDRAYAHQLWLQALQQI